MAFYDLPTERVVDILRNLSVNDLRSFLSTSQELNEKYRPFFERKVRRAELVDIIMKNSIDNEDYRYEVYDIIQGEFDPKFFDKAYNLEVFNVLKGYPSEELAKKLIKFQCNKKHTYEYDYEERARKLITPSEYDHVFTQVIKLALKRLTLKKLEEIFKRLENF